MTVIEFACACLGAFVTAFDSTRFHHVLVIDSDNKLIGVVSDRDLLRALSPYVGTNVETARDVATLNKRVHQIMTRKPVILGPDASIEDAVELFLAPRRTDSIESSSVRVFPTCRRT